MSPVSLTGQNVWLRTTKSGFKSWAGGQCGSAVYPRERALWRESVGKAVSQYLSHFNLVVQEEERLVPRKFVVLTAPQRENWFGRFPSDVGLSPSKST